MGCFYTLYISLIFRTEMSSYEGLFISFVTPISFRTNTLRVIVLTNLVFNHLRFLITVSNNPYSIGIL